MVKPKLAKNALDSWKVLSASLLLGGIHLVCVSLLLVSTSIILSQYVQIILGNRPTDMQKMSLDYSIPIFTGTALFLLAYQYQVEALVRKLFGVDEKWNKGKSK